MNIIFLVVILLFVFILLKFISRQKNSKLDGWRRFSKTYRAKEKFSILGPVEKCAVCGGYGIESEGFKEGKVWLCSKNCKEKWESQSKS